MSRKRKSSGPRAALIVAAVGLLGLGALAAYVKWTPADRVPVSIRRTEVIEPRDRVGKPADRVASEKSPSRVMVPQIVDEQLRLVPADVDGDPMLRAAEACLSAVGATQLEIGSVSVQGGTATIDLAGTVPAGLGSSQESLLIRSFQQVFGQFPDVDQIEFKVGGQPVESIGGHAEASDPFPVLRAGQTSTTPDGESVQP